MVKFVRKPFIKSVESFCKANTEPPFSEKAMAMEVRDLLQHTYVAIFRQDGNGISCNFYNGQQFRITIEEEKDNVESIDNILNSICHDGKTVDN